MSDFRKYTPPRLNKTVLLVAAGCALLIGATVTGSLRRSVRSALPDLAQKIVDTRNAGEYERTLSLLDEAAQNQTPTLAIRTLEAEIRQDLKPDLEIHYSMRRTSAVRQLSDPLLKLAPGDQFYFTLNLLAVARPAYVYLFLVDSEGVWSVLLPNKIYAPSGNPLPPALYQVPDKTQKRLHPPNTPGSEKLFAVAAYWRIGALEDIASELSVEPAARTTNVGDRLLARLQLEEAKPVGLHGLSVGTKEFEDSGPPEAQGSENP